MNSLPVQVTPRDQEILACLVTGASNRQIAGELNIAEQTVKAHLRSMFLRLGMFGGGAGKRGRLIKMIAPKEQATGRKIEFTKAELEVAFLLGDGAKVNAEIAELCGTSSGTIRNRLHTMYDKCGVWNRQEFILWWASHAHMYSQSNEARPA